MKKLISLFAIAALAFAIVGCSGSQDQAANPESTTTTTAPTDAAATGTEGAQTGEQAAPGTEGEKTGEQAAPATGTEGEKTGGESAPAEGETK
ncbi:MAG: hypothetical protein ACK41F_06445 [Fimbriimonadaceae bacterium]